MGIRSILALATFAAILAPIGVVAEPDCQCRAEGRFFKQGTIACIDTPSGQKLAQCDMSQNVLTWRVVADQCPVALQSSPQEPVKATRFASPQLAKASVAPIDRDDWVPQRPWRTLLARQSSANAIAVRRSFSVATETARS